MQSKVGPSHLVERLNNQGTPSINNFELIFDFTLLPTFDQIREYQQFKGKAVFLNAVLFSLQSVAEKGLPTLLGFNGHPTFFKRQILEVSSMSDENSRLVKELLQPLNIEYELVDDRVGMVTPWIIGMIINEAFYTLMEDVASRKDIDLGMKLGTNYPMGPFEWVEKWGISNVFLLLEALYQDTHDERYKICPLLKREYSKNKLNS